MRVAIAIELVSGISVACWVGVQLCKRCRGIGSDLPKIIHQTAPADQSKWDPIWHSCHASWKRVYPDYQHILWDDASMDRFVKLNYPQYYEMYTSYPRNIHRIDAARYFILHSYGGIYADMDYAVMRDFMHLIPSGKVSISESPYKENENCQNALMMSPSHHPFWKRVFDEMTTSKHHSCVISVAGPQMLDRAIAKYEGNDVNILPFKQFNPHKNESEIRSNNPNIYTKHYGTSVWSRSAT